MQRFRPYLVDVSLRQLPRLPVAPARRLYRPEAAIACRVAQVTRLLVRRSKEHALPQMRRGALAEGCAVDVVLPRQERAQRLNLRLPQSRKLADLHDPETLQLLRRRLVLGVVQRQAVVEPLPAQLGDERRLAHALRTIEHQHGVELDARLEHALDGRAQRLARHRAHIQVVRRTQVVDEQRLNAGHAIPFGQRSQIIPDRMIRAVVRHFPDGDVVVAVAEGTVPGFDVADDLLIVCVPPELGRVLPWHGRNVIPDFHAVRELVEHDAL